MKEVQKYIESVLKGVGQVMLQENSWTGLLFLVGLAFSSIYLASLALVATILAITNNTIPIGFIVDFLLYILKFIVAKISVKINVYCLYFLWIYGMFN